MLEVVAISKARLSEFGPPNFEEISDCSEEAVVKLFLEIAHALSIADARGLNYATLCSCKAKCATHVTAYHLASCPTDLDGDAAHYASRAHSAVNVDARDVHIGLAFAPPMHALAKKRGQQQTPRSAVFCAATREREPFDNEEKKEAGCCEARIWREPISIRRVKKKKGTPRTSKHLVL